MLTKKYGIYSPDGEKLENSNDILTDEKRFWHPITESVLDRIPNDVFGILLHPVYVNGVKCWIVRESEKWDLKQAAWWYNPV